MQPDASDWLLVAQNYLFPICLGSLLHTALLHLLWPNCSAAALHRIHIKISIAVTVPQCELQGGGSAVDCAACLLWLAGSSHH